MEDVKQPVQELQQRWGNTSVAISEGGGLEHLYGHRSSPTLTQPRRRAALGQPVKATSTLRPPGRQRKPPLPRGEAWPSLTSQGHPRGGQCLGCHCGAGGKENRQGKERKRAKRSMEGT